MKVAELMTPSVATVPASASLADAARVMWDHDCGIVPVVADDQTLCGVITDRDICMGGLSTARPLREIPVTVSMAASPRTCRATDEVEVVHDLMREHQIRRIPVLDADAHVEGLVSLNDLALAAMHAEGARRDEQEREVARSLETISEHVVSAEEEGGAPLLCDVRPGTNILELVIDGKLTPIQVQTVQTMCEDLITEHGSMRLLKEVRSVGGVELKGFWKNLRFSLRHLKDIERCAVVADKTWVKVWTKLTKPLVAGEVRYFESKDLAAAKAWLAEGLVATEQLDGMHE